MTRAKDQLIAPNEHQAHPLSYEGGVWVCPVTKRVVQKTLKANIAQRRAVLLAADSNPLVQGVLWHECKRSFPLWVNLFVRTYRQHEVLPDGSQKPVAHANVPMITWPVQDYAAAKIIDAINGGRDILIDKSRDMGASWLCLLVLLWFWLFYDDCAFKVLSRKEEEVDAGEDPSSLFYKLRFVLQHLPPWMKPAYGDKRMQLPNRNNGSVIKGESTNNDAGRGGRLKAVLLDECSAYDNLEEIERATHQAASTRIYNATPKGPGKYSDLRFSGKVEVIVLGHWDHPEKGRGRYLKIEDGKVRWSSPWRDQQLEHVDARTVAQNIDIDHERAGSMFFDSMSLSLQASTFAQGQTFIRGDIVTRLQAEDLDAAIMAYEPGQPMPWSFKESDRGVMRIWLPLVKYGKELRPPQNRIYGSGWDISMGTGASNSAGCFLDYTTGEQVAEWCSGTVDPARLARIACMLGYWFGGLGGLQDRENRRSGEMPTGCAYLAWENNGGGGQIFTRNVRTLDYRWKHYHVNRKGDSDVITDTLGWTSSPTNKLDVLGALRTAMGMNTIQIRSPELLKEAGRYVFARTGEVEPATMENQGKDARATHGDRLIAAAVAWEGKLRANRMPVPKLRPHPDSVLARRRLGAGMREPETFDDGLTDPDDDD
jgi:hypothetical protein